MKIHRCNRIKANGVPCQSPALRGHTYCFYHHNNQLRENRRIKLGGPDAISLTIGSLEDGDSIQAAILNIMNAVIDRNIDRATAQTLLYSLQLAMANLKNTNPRPGSWEETVTELEYEDDEDFDAIDHAAEAAAEAEDDDEEEVEEVIVASSLTDTAAAQPVSPKAPDTSRRKPPASVSLEQLETDRTTQLIFDLTNFSRRTDT